jgi:hypothetical protein
VRREGFERLDCLGCCRRSRHGAQP